MDTMLNQDPDLLTTPNIRKRTPTDIAMQCTGYLEVERRYTVVVFEHYQIITPDKPMYKSPTAEVHEAVDLRLSDASRAEGRLALKLIAGPHLWQRELEVRQMLSTATDGVVMALSAAIADVTSSNTATGGDDVAHAAVRYARSNSTDTQVIHIVAEASMAGVRRKEARGLMSHYSCCICMPLADRNLLEIIQAERLAEEPMEVIRHTGLKMATLINSLHAHGVVHGDIKVRFPLLAPVFRDRSGYTIPRPKATSVHITDPWNQHPTPATPRACGTPTPHPPFLLAEKHCAG